MRNVLAVSFGFSVAKLIVFVMIGLALIVSLAWRDGIDGTLGLRERQSVTRFELGGLSVHFVDVGQGDATIIRLPDDKTILIDAGPQSSVGVLLQYIKNNLGQNGKFEYFDYIIATNASQGSIGGMPDVVYRFANKYHTTIFRPNTRAINANDPSFVDLGTGHLEANSYNTHDSAVYRRAVQAIHNSGCQVLVNHLTEFSIVADASSKQWYAFGIVPFADTNLLGSNFSVQNASPIMLLEYMGKRFVFSGSAQEQVETQFVEKYRGIFGNEFYVDVIMIGNHGDDKSSSQAYLDFLMTPNTASNTIVILSTAKENSHTNPSRMVLQRLDDNGIDRDNIFYTAQLSHILLSLGSSTNSAINITTAHWQLLDTHPYLLWWWHIVVLAIVVLFAILFVKLTVKSKQVGGTEMLLQD